MSVQEQRSAAAAMMEQAQNLQKSGDPVLAMTMSRVIAALHETRQLIDPEYLPLIAGQDENGGLPVAAAKISALDAIATRISAPRLIEPAPTVEQLQIILEAATHAPDHGRLGPWRFVVIEGESRKKFGDLMIEALKTKKPDAPDSELSRESAKAMRAPMIVTVAAHPTPRPGVPDIEQIVAVGAATQNMFLAAFAQGLGAMWKTGSPAYDAGVKRGLGLEEGDTIVGFLYLGTAENLSVPRRPPAPPIVHSL